MLSKNYGFIANTCPDYLQFDGTYLVSKVPRVAGAAPNCAVAATAAEDAHAQSIEPESPVANAALFI